MKSRSLDPGTDQVWEALRALYLVGQPEDIPAIRPYERELPEIPDHVRKQAMETEQAIRSGRSKSRLLAATASRRRNLA